jgi:hypothetical protein
MDRKERFLKITASEKNGAPLALYSPNAYVSLRVERGQIYRVALSDGELQAVVEDARLAEEVMPGTFDVYHSLVSGDWRTNPLNGFVWERQTA